MAPEVQIPLTAVHPGDTPPAKSSLPPSLPPSAVTGLHLWTLTAHPRRSLLPQYRVLPFPQL